MEPISVRLDPAVFVSPMKALPAAAAHLYLGAMIHQTLYELGEVVDDKTVVAIAHAGGYKAQPAVGHLLEAGLFERAEGGYRVVLAPPPSVTPTVTPRDRTGAERSRRYRDRRRDAEGVAPPVTVTPEAVTDRDARRDNATSPPQTPPVSPASGSEQAAARNHGNNGASRSKARAECLPGFLLFWSEYPRKEAKDAAYRAWIKRGLEPKTEEILTAVRRQKAHLMRDDPASGKQPGELCPHPATWLNGGRWQDEPLPLSPRTVATPKTAGNVAAGRAFIDRMRTEGN